MVEILLHIKPEDVPPVARGLVSTDVGGNPKFLTRGVKDALYPGWDTYRDSENIPEILKSFYIVRCETEAQAFLARSLAPDNVRTEIIIEKPESLPLNSKHPLTESIKTEGARRLTNTIHVLSIGFANLSLLTANSLLLFGNYSPNERLIMSGLVVVGASLSMSAILLTSPQVREELANFLTKYNFLYNLPKTAN